MQAQRGSIFINPRVDVAQLFVAHVQPELVQPVQAGNSVLRSSALKYLWNFRTHVGALAQSLASGPAPAHRRDSLLLPMALAAFSSRRRRCSSCFPTSSRTWAPRTPSCTPTPRLSWTPSSARSATARCTAAPCARRTTCTRGLTRAFSCRSMAHATGQHPDGGAGASSGRAPDGPVQHHRSSRPPRPRQGGRERPRHARCVPWFACGSSKNDKH